jgi:hypothetical protein
MEAMSPLGKFSKLESWNFRQYNAEWQEEISGDCGELAGDPHSPNSAQLPHSSQQMA